MYSSPTESTFFVSFFNNYFGKVVFQFWSCDCFCNKNWNFGPHFETATFLILLLLLLLILFVYRYGASFVRQFLRNVLFKTWVQVDQHPLVHKREWEVACMRTSVNIFNFLIITRVANITRCPILYGPSVYNCLGAFWRYTVLFHNINFSGVSFVLLCNHEYIHCLNHRETKDYIRNCNKF